MAFGNAHGQVNTDKQSIKVSSWTGPKQIDLEGSIEVDCSGGKLADSLDSFVFIYRIIDPRKENFRISSEFKVEKAAGDDMSGVAVGAVDTVISNSKKSRHRNYALSGWFRTKKRLVQNHGVRIVTGYEDIQAEEPEGRITDASREFSTEGKLMESGDTAFFSAEKTDDGFTFSDGSGTISISGSDFLLRQDSEFIYAGIAVAGKMKVEISSVCFEKSEGRLSKTHEKFTETLPIYPDVALPSEDEKRISYAQIFVSPEGKEDSAGTEDEPMNLEAAVKRAEKDVVIIMKDGFYKIRKSLFITGSSVNLRAENEGGAVIDAWEMEEETPAVIISGDENRIVGIKVICSHANGILVCGNDNIIARCITAFNKDTGILICSLYGEERENWPS